METYRYRCRHTHTHSDRNTWVHAYTFLGPMAPVLGISTLGQDPGLEREYVGHRVITGWGQM